MEQDQNLREHYQRRFRFVLVDEYQDTNAAQYRFVQLIGGRHRNVMVVGDDDQSIYGWRGADIRNILDFERDFPGARIVRLEENYRSTPNVLALANAVIAENTERRGKTLRATRPAGEPVTLIETLDERDEADFIAETILTRMAKSDLSRRDCAILYRTNAQSRAIEDAFRRRSIPYRLIGAVRFYDRREIRDLMAYLKLVANPADDEGDTSRSAGWVMPRLPCSLNARPSKGSHCWKSHRDSTWWPRCGLLPAPPSTNLSRWYSGCAPSRSTRPSTSCCGISCRPFATPIICALKAPRGSSASRTYAK